MGDIVNGENHDGELPEVHPHAEDAMEGEVGPERQRMPIEREGLTHHFKLDGVSGYLVANRKADGQLGELFIHGIGKPGSTLHGLIDGFAIMLSIGLQYGAELPMLARKFAHMKFEPNGPTDNPDIPHCWSLFDYIFRWLALHFADEALSEELRRIDEDMAKAEPI